MRIIIETDNGCPHGLGRQGFIVEPATPELLQQLRAAQVGDPDEVLSIPNTRLHMTVGTTGTASIRAGHITSVREG